MRKTELQTDCPESGKIQISTVMSTSEASVGSLMA